jgi:hypothetical protein
MAAHNSTALVETPSAQLARVLNGLEPTRAQAVRAGFEAMFASVEAWETEAAGLVVTDESQVPKMKRARLLRLEIKNARVELDKRRKQLKEGILVEGRAIDGAFRIFEGLAAPLESRLLEQETFGERAAKTREDALASARADALSALGVAREAMPAGLGRMTEDLWGPVLEDARLAKQAREQRAREEEEARVEAERILRERREQEKIEAQKREAERIAREEAQRAETEKQRAEAQRLQAELELREREARAERERVEAEQRAERQKHEAELAEQQRLADVARKEAEDLARDLETKRLIAEENARRERAERERVETERREQDRREAAAREAAELAPDREKLQAFAETLREMTLRLEKPKAQELWLKVRQRLAKLASDIETAAAQM